MTATRSPLWIPALFIVLLALTPVLAGLFGGAQSYWVSLVTRIIILAIAALSLDLILGIGGLVSFGHAAFFGIGAYAAAILIHEGQGDILLILPVAMGAAGLFALVTGAISLRTKGVTFIMITLAFGQMAYFMGQALYAYGGDDGLTLYGRATLLGWPVFRSKIAFFYSSLAILAGAYLLLRAIAGSRFGRALQAARDNPVRVASLGFDVTRVRLIAYIISGKLAALAGVLMANHTEFVSPAFMAWQRSGELIFMVIVGGIGSLWGAMVGAAVFLLLEEILSGFTTDWKVIFGPLIILFVLFVRGGLSGLMGRITGANR